MRHRDTACGATWLRLCVCAAALFLPSLAIAQPGGSPFSELEKLQQPFLEDAKQLYKSILPTPAQLNADLSWKLPWEAPPQARGSVKTQDEYWQKFLKNAVPVGLDAATAGRVFDISVAQMAQSGQPGVGAREAGMAMLVMYREVSSPLAVHTETELSGAARVFSLASKAQRGDGRLDPATQKQLIEAAFHPYNQVPAEQMKPLFVSKATLVRKQSTMTYYKSNNWPGLANAKSDADLVKNGIWYGWVDVNARLLDEKRVAEFEDLKDAPALQGRLNQSLAQLTSPLLDTRRAQVQRQIEEMQEERRKSIKSLQDELAAVKKEGASVAAIRGPMIQQQIDALQNDPDFNREIDELREQLGEEEKAVKKASIEVHHRKFGENSYVIRMTGNYAETPGLTVSQFSGYVRNGPAVITIKFEGNFPEDVMLKEMDHFLSEMDARTQSYAGGLDGDLGGDLGGDLPAPTRTPGASGTPVTSGTPTTSPRNTRPADPPSATRDPVPSTPPTPTAPTANSPSTPGTTRPVTPDTKEPDTKSPTVPAPRTTADTRTETPPPTTTRTTPGVSRNIPGASRAVPDNNPSPHDPRQPAPTTTTQPGNDNANPATTPARTVDVSKAFELQIAGKYKEAIAEFDRLLRDHPGHPSVLYGRAYTKMWNNDLKGALADFIESGKADARDLDSPRHRATLELVAGDPRVGLKEAESLLKRQPDDLRVHALHAKALLWNNDIAGAQKVLAKIIAFDAKYLDALYEEGNHYLARNVPALAYLNYSAVLYGNPNYIGAYYGYGFACSRLGYKDRAIAALERYLQSDRNSQYARAAWDEIQRIKAAR